MLKYFQIRCVNMEEKKENELAFNDENYEEQFENAIKNGKELLKKNKKIEIPQFLLKNQEGTKE